MQKPFKLAIDLQRLTRLSDDLVAVRSGKFNFRTIADAPVLEDVSVVTGEAPFLEGIVHGHPRLADGHRIVTSQFWALCEADALYARTLSRWYRIKNNNLDQWRH